MSKPTKFRYDINGLRAYAMLFVLLFHFQVPGFEGGFVGVDVFFVISGYLMTKIVIDGINKHNGGDFTWLLKFYIARASRILPALIALCIVLLVMGWFFLPSIDYHRLGIHTVSALIFLSNIKFWLEAGYFDAASHEKWLLHTWSLSVEWQFYILFPIFLMLAWRLWPSQRSLFITIACGFLISLYLSITLTPKQPSAAFYLLPTRAWELFAGGLVYFISQVWQFTATRTRLFETIGFICILIAAIGFSKHTPWPGTAAILPVLGASLIILAARQDSYWTHAKPIQAIGHWSYSIYLWHWPIVVALIYFELLSNTFFILFSIVFSIFLGAKSFFLIENPTRHFLKGLALTPSIVILSLITLSISVPSLFLWQKKGIEGRLSSEAELLASEANNFNHQRRKECHGRGGSNFRSCIHGGVNISVILIGDSHASAVATAVQNALLLPEQGVLTFTYTSCPTIFDIKNTNRTDLKCAEFNEWVMEQIAELPSNVPVIIVNRISGYVLGSNRPDESSYGRPSTYFEHPVSEPTYSFKKEFKQRLIESACRIAELRPVALVRPLPEMLVDVPRQSARQILLGQTPDIHILRRDYHDRHALVWSAQDYASKHCDIKILDPTSWLCDTNRCDGLRNGRPIYYDSHHLSEYGNKFLVPMFTQFLAEH